MQFLQRARQSRPPLDDGTTAIAALVVGDTVIVANGECLDTTALCGLSSCCTIHAGSIQHPSQPVILEQF